MKKNYFLFLPLIIIIIYSFLNLYNAKLLDSQYVNIVYKQMLWYLIGFIIIIINKKIKLHYIYKSSFYFYIISIIFLLLTLFIGKNINGAKAWLSLGFISFQPSELVRITLTLYLTYFTFNYKFNGIISEAKYLLISFLIVLFPSLLVFLEPDTGAVLFYLIIYLTILIMAKLNYKWYILIFIFTFSLLGIFIYMFINKQDLLINLIGTSIFYRIDRLVNFYINTGYQMENALVIIGSSTLFGTGINNILLYIPEGINDFSLAFLTGNYGIISLILVLISYLVIDIYLIKNETYIKNKRNKMFIASFISVFFFQQFYNIFMNINLLPIMGIPLPFLSYGGSTIIVYFLYLSLILKMFSTEDMLDNNNYKNNYHKAYMDS
jgi:rod shape determining protein RodA